MNELFLAMAEQGLLKARQAAPPRTEPRPGAGPASLSSSWGQRLLQVLGHSPELPSPRGCGPRRGYRAAAGRGG